MSVEPQTSAIRLEREIFLGALEKADPGQREAFLDSACGRNVLLRRRIEELLREESSVGAFLEQPVWTASKGVKEEMAGPHFSVAAITEKPGDQIGHYTLVQQIGEGGCGVVYQAHQEEPFRREIALKVIKLGMDTRQVIARFEAERQTLALMDHFNIARVFDAGATQSGRPFFVMELVRGIRLTQHCDLNQLGLRERLELFIQVCHGIQHAHQKGVIHRDIKPSNILVSTQDGLAVPKIIDFGIARAIHRQLAAQLTEITGFGQLIGTPAYMSPEQATLRPVEIDTRSDIYSLGVMLYELLTGRTPFDGQLLAQDPDEWRRVIREQEPARPSNLLASLSREELAAQAAKLRSEPTRLVRALRGDLDWVLMKALEKDRARRYATASELAQDLERYLAKEPVLARPPSNVYRLQKLMHRHRTAFITVAGTAVLLLIATFISAGLALRATRAETDARLSEKMQVQLRREAELERERAQSQAAAARLSEYIADINLAQQSLASGNYGRAVQLLKKHLPQLGVPDLRGFEWRYLWQLSRGDDHLAFPDQGSSVRSLAVSPDGRWLAVGTDNRLNLWELSSGSLIRTFALHQISTVFCQEGRALVVSTPSEVRVFDLGSGSETTLPDQDGGALAVSKDGGRVAISSRDGVRLWDTRNWTVQLALPGAFAPLAFSPDGQILATATRDGLTLWDLAHAKPKLVLQNSRTTFPGRTWDQLGKTIAFSSDGNKLVAPRNIPSERGIFRLAIWNTLTGEEIEGPPSEGEQAQHNGTIASLAVSPDGNTVATASMDHSIRIWDLQSRRDSITLHGHLSEVWSVAFTPDGSTLISGAKDGSVNLWSVPITEKNDVLAGPYSMAGFSRDGRRMAVLDQKRSTLVFLDSETRRTLAELPLERGRFRGPGRVALSANLDVVAESAGRGVVKLYHPGTREVTELQVGQSPGLELALSPDGQQLLTSGFGQPARWWDLTTRTNTPFGTMVRRPLFSPDGRTLLVLSGSGRAELWNVPNRALRTVLNSDSPFGQGAAFSPDGRLVAIASDPLNAEQTIGLWDTASGHPLGNCIGHKQGILALAFSPDGRTLASVSHDSTLKLWNTSALQQLLTFSIPGGASDPVFSPDGTLLAVGQSFQPNGIRFYPAPQPVDNQQTKHPAVFP